MTTIHAIITYHLKVFFWYVLYKTFDEFHGRYGLGDKDFVLMSVVVESDSIMLFIIRVNS